MNKDRLEVILDLSPLGEAWDHPSAARGIHRVCQHLFHGLLDSKRCDLRFVSTTNLAGTYHFLSEQGLDPDHSLSFSAVQLRRSRISRKAAQWVHQKLKIPGLKARARRGAMATFANVMSPADGSFPSHFLKGADIYHSPLRPVPRLVREDAQLKNFLTIHDLLPLTHPDILKPGSDLYIKKLIGSVSPASFIFCVSEFVKSDVLSLTKADPAKVFVTPLAADLSKFFPVDDDKLIQEIRGKYGFSERPYFLTLSSFDPRKNFGHIIQCFSKLLQSGDLKDELLVIVGSNPERNRFVEHAVAQNPKIRDHLLMLGFVLDEDLAAIYTGALAFLFPSLGEGFGLPVLEAMQCGTPVLSSNSTSLPEVVGDAGILLSPTDHDSWCHAMLEMVQNSDLRAKLRRSGLERSRLFTWDKFIDSTCTAYSVAMSS